MSGSLRAMLWELWRTSRIDLLGRFGYSVAIVIFFVKVGTSDAIETARGLVVLIAAIFSVLSMVWIRELDRGSGGFSYRLGFTRPVPTWKLVAVPMLFATCVSCGTFLVPTVLFSTLTGTSLPIFSPLLFVACAGIWLTAATWAPAAIVDKLLALAAVVVLIAAFIIRYNAIRDYGEPFILAIGRPNYFQLSAVHYAALLLTTAAAAVGAVVAVGQQRRGESLSFARPVSTFCAGLFTGGRVGKPFRNRMTAQFAFEFRRCAPQVLTLGVLSPALLWGFGQLVLWMYPHAGRSETIWQGEPILWMLALTLSPFVFQLLGASALIGLTRVENVWRFSAFDATRSMTNGQLVAVKLVVIAVCSTIAWACIWIGALLWFRFGTDEQIGARLSAAAVQIAGEVPGTWWLGALCSVTLSYISLTSVMLAFGLWMPRHPRLLVAISVLAYAHLGVAAYDKHHDWRGANLWVAYGYVVATFIVAVCVYAVWKALQDRAISAKAMTCVGALWLVHVVMTTSLAMKSPELTQIPVPAIAVLAAMLLIPLASTVCAPLALASQRHR